MDSQRVPCMTYFGSMSKQDDEAEHPGVVLHGRWSDAGTASGTFICESPDYTSVADWLYNWAPMANITLKPICDDNTAREILLGEKSSYTVSYDNVSDEPEEGETLFLINYSFYADKKLEGQKAFASLTQEQDTADAGECRPLGRWHDLGSGSGCAIAAAKSEKDLYKWANNWAALCECKVSPVLTDTQARKIITGKPDYGAKLAKVMADLAPAPTAPPAKRRRFFGI